MLKIGDVIAYKLATGPGYGLARVLEVAALVTVIQFVNWTDKNGETHTQADVKELTLNQVTLILNRPLNKTEKFWLDVHKRTKATAKPAKRKAA